MKLMMLVCKVDVDDFHRGLEFHVVNAFIN